MTRPWPQLQQLIDRHQRFLITSHRRPDCDALGSELALATLLERRGKQVAIVNADPTPPRLAFVDPAQRIQVLGRDVTAAQLEPLDVLFVLDTSAWGQLGDMAEVVRATRADIVVIDHHASDGELAASVICKDESSEATGRLVYELAKFLDDTICREVAVPLFAALATDTGWFRFPSVTGTTYRVVGELIDAGAAPHEVYRHLYEQDSLARAKLRGRMLEHLQTDHGGRLAFSGLRTADFAATGATSSDTEDFINLALALADAEVAVLFVEQPDGAVKVSLRSSAGVDCSQIAARFGGGGHRPAAGATIQGPWQQVQTRVLKAVGAALKPSR